MSRTTTDAHTENLIAQHISPHPANPGLDEYWLARPGVSIWAVIGTLRANGDDPDATIRLYHLTPDEFAAALAFYERHRAIIEHRLAQNDAP